MWVTKLLISPVKKRIFCPKTTKFGPKLAFLVNLGQAMQAYSVPCWWVGWWLWRAGCISQDTYLLYVGTKTFTYSHKNQDFWPKNGQNMHFWSFWAKYCHFLHILSNAQPKTNVNQVPRWVFCHVGNKTFDFSSRNQDFLPQNDQIWPKIGIFGQFGPGHAGLFSALLVGRLVVVARGLYLARHLFTLYWRQAEQPYFLSVSECVRHRCHPTKSPLFPIYTGIQALC